MFFIDVPNILWASMNKYAKLETFAIFAGYFSCENICMYDSVCLFRPTLFTGFLVFSLVFSN